MGQSKQLLHLGGEPILRHVLRSARMSRLGEVIVVLGHEAETIAGAIGDLGQKTVVNASYDKGQSTSIQAGLAAVNPDADAAMFLLGDQPGVTAAVIEALVDAYELTKASVVQPNYGGIFGNPVVFGRELFADLHAVTGDTGGRDIIRANEVRRHVVRFALEAPPPDVDTPEAYAALQAAWGARPARE
jgi:molybdenum cofactor cytidylyltransferase